MVCDSLHIICGNCGAYLTSDNENNEKARATIEHNGIEPVEIYIHCENCGTVHDLSQYMEILY